MDQSLEDSRPTGQPGGVSHRPLRSHSRRGALNHEAFYRHALASRCVAGTFYTWVEAEKGFYLGWPGLPDDLAPNYSRGETRLRRLEPYPNDRISFECATTIPVECDDQLRAEYAPQAWQDSNAKAPLHRILVPTRISVRQTSSNPSSSAPPTLPAFAPPPRSPFALPHSMRPDNLIPLFDSPLRLLPLELLHRFRDGRAQNLPGSGTGPARCVETVSDVGRHFLRGGILV